MELFRTTNAVVPPKVPRRPDPNRFTPPSARPVLLLKLRIRPLRATMNWLGPAAPMDSGGKEFSVSASVAPRKFKVRTCGALGPGAEPEPESGKLGASGEPGLEGRF